MVRRRSQLHGQLAFIGIRQDQDITFGLATYELQAKKSGVPSPVRSARFYSVPDEIRDLIRVLVGSAPQNGMLLPKRDQLLEEAEEIAVLAQQSPVSSN